MNILKRIQLASKGISLVTCLWLAYFAFSYYKTGDENNLLVGGLSILAFIIILVARSIFGGNKVKMPVEDHEGVWISEAEADEQFKSIGKPGYDPEAGMVRGKTAMFDELKENTDVVNITAEEVLEYIQEYPKNNPESKGWASVAEIARGLGSPLKSSVLGDQSSGDMVADGIVIKTIHDLCVPLVEQGYILKDKSIGWYISAPQAELIREG